MKFGITGWDGVDDPEIYLEGHLDIEISVAEIPISISGNVGESLEMMRFTAEYIVRKFEQSFI